MLHEAQVRAADQSDTGIHVAVVALDGVCELAAGLAAHELGVRISEGGLPGLIGRVREKLKGNWGQDGSKAFHELHRARNSAQHEGVLPQASHLPIWSTEVERFVRSLIAAAFGVDLSDVSAADAVADDDLRQLLLDAEGLIEAEEYEAAIKSSNAAIVRALRDFRQRRGRSRTVTTPDPLGLGEVNTIKALNAAVENLESFLDIATLASDPGEWIWLQATHEVLGHTEEPVGREEAQRALVFALNWVLRYEVFKARYGDPRYVHGARGPNPWATYEKPRLVSVSYHGSVNEPVMLQIGLSDVPPGWYGGLQTAITAVRTAGDIPEGIQPLIGGQLLMDAPEETDPHVVRRLIDRLIDETHRIFEDGLRALRVHAEEAQAAAQQYRAAVEQLGPERRIVSVTPGDGKHEAFGLLRIAVNLPHGVNGFHVANHLTGELSGQGIANPRIDTRGEGDVLIVPAGIPPDVLLPLLDKSVADVERIASAQQAEQAALQRRREKLVAGLQALIDTGPDVQRGAD
jgi:hypothetical protein